MPRRCLRGSASELDPWHHDPAPCVFHDPPTALPGASPVFHVKRRGGGSVLSRSFVEGPRVPMRRAGKGRRRGRGAPTPLRAVPEFRRISGTGGLLHLTVPGLLLQRPSCFPRLLPGSPPARRGRRGLPGRPEVSCWRTAPRRIPGEARRRWRAAPSTVRRHARGETVSRAPARAAMDAPRRRGMFHVKRQGSAPDQDQVEGGLLSLLVVVKVEA